MAHAPGGDAAVLRGAGEFPWAQEPETALALAAAAAVWALGALRLGARGQGALSARRVLCAAGGLAALAVALVSPLAGLAHRSFAAHMAQHMLLVAVAAPLLLLADPFPVAVWALPAAVRGRAGKWITRGSLLGRAWTRATAMPAAWLSYAGALWLWHLPVAYDAALSARPLHHLEHSSFFLGAVLFWWPVIRPAPRFRPAGAPALRIAYLVLAALQTAALGLLLTVAPALLYRAYAAPAGAAARHALDDQARGGLVMWGVGGLVDMLAVLAVLYRALGDDARSTGCQRRRPDAGRRAAPGPTS